MKIAAASVLTLLALSGTALAEFTTLTGPMAQASERLVLDRAGNASRQPVGFGNRGPAFVDIYDNVNSTALAAGANANLFLGDNVITTGVGDIREFEFSLFNGGTAIWTRTDISVIFFEFNGLGYDLLGQLNFNDVTVGLSPGFFTTLTVTDPGITLSNNDVIAAVRFTDVQGIAANQAGQIRSGPVPVIGTSANDIFVETAPGNFTFAAFPSNNNLMYRIAVPAPGALALLGLGGIVAARRRR